MRFLSSCVSNVYVSAILYFCLPPNCAQNIGNNAYKYEKQLKSDFLASTWERCVAALDVTEPIDSLISSIVPGQDVSKERKQLIKMKLEGFIRVFEDVQKTCRGKYSIPNKSLREQLVQLSLRCLSSYETLFRFASQVTLSSVSSKQRKLLKYEPTDVSEAVATFFEEDQRRLMRSD